MTSKNVGAEPEEAGGPGVSSGSGPYIRVPFRAAATAAAIDTSRPSDARYEPAATISSVCRAIARSRALMAPPL